MLPFGGVRDRLESVRWPAVAGIFYPDDPGELGLTVDGLLTGVSVREIEERIVGLIVPHAGYSYSGGVAAPAFAALRRQRPKRVILLGPSHVEAFSGASLFGGRAYATPLGEVPIDREFAEGLVGQGVARFSEAGHATANGGRGEHALEVELPFLQRILDAFRIVPIVLGDRTLGTCRRLGAALARRMTDDTVILASSDLSHFHPVEQAQILDRRTADLLRRWDYFSLHAGIESGDCEACGAGPILTLMIAAQQAGADDITVLQSATSGDVPPFRRDSVVGYLSAVLTSSGAHRANAGPSLSEGDRRRLLYIARESVRRAVWGEPPLGTSGEAASLQRLSAVFVTLRRNGRLRGCIGSIGARETMAGAVASSAASAALRDPRFAPVDREELDSIDLHISVLAPFRLLVDPLSVEVGREGLLVDRGTRRGLLLPQVAPEQGWDAATFLAQTCRKAGLELDAWRDPETAVYAFTAEGISDETS